jgi:hypothetical protein
MKSAAGWRGGRGLAVMASACALLAGCGGGTSEPKAVPASGTANDNGKPIEKGTIHFVPEKGRSASGPIENGKFTLTTYEAGDGAVVGQHKVSLEVTQEYKDREGDTATKSIIAKKYADHETSKIVVDVPPGGKTDIVVDVKDAK